MKTLYLFPDTNVFLQCKPLDQLSWAALGDFDEIELVVTRPVQKEIDALKGKGNSRQAARARTAASLINLLLDCEDHRHRVRDGKPVVHLRLDLLLRPEKPQPDSLDYEQHDDQLVGIVLGYPNTPLASHRVSGCREHADSSQRAFGRRRSAPDTASDGRVVAMCRSAGAADLFEDLAEWEGGAVWGSDVGYARRVGQKSTRRSWTKTWLPRRATSPESERKNGQHLPAVHAVKSQNDSPSTSGVSSILPSLMARRPRCGAIACRSSSSSRQTESGTPAPISVGSLFTEAEVPVPLERSLPHPEDALQKMQEQPICHMDARHANVRPALREMTRSLSLMGRVICP